MRPSFRLLAVGFLGAMVVAPAGAHAATITYYNLDGSSLAEGEAFLGFGDPSVVPSSNLTGNALQFERNDQWVWLRNAAESTTHYVGFDYYAPTDAQVTFFLDTPTILRFDITTAGTHHVDLYFDLTSETALAFLDHVFTPGLLTVPVWGSSAQQIRFVNQAFSTFEVDNIVWQGDVRIPVPEPSSMFLLGSGGLALLAVVRRRRS